MNTNTSNSTLFTLSATILSTHSEHKLALLKLSLLHQFCFMQFCYFGYNGNVFNVLPYLNLMAALMCPKYREERGIFKDVRGRLV